MASCLLITAPLLEGEHRPTYQVYRQPFYTLYPRPAILHLYTRQLHYEHTILIKHMKYNYILQTKHKWILYIWFIKKLEYNGTYFNDY